MYRNVVKFYEGDLFSNMVLFAVPFILFWIRNFIVHNIQIDRNLKEKFSKNRILRNFEGVLFFLLFISVVLLGIFCGNWAYSGDMDLPLLISGGSLYLFSFLGAFLSGREK